MKIGGLQRLSLIDFPGRLAGIVFAQGCNLRCRYCHNPGLVSQEGAETLSWEDVVCFFDNRRGKLDGVVFSGGEPLLQNDLTDAVSQLRRLGFAIKLDTNGLYPERLAALISQGLVDYVAMDLKAPVEDYPRLTQVAVDREVFQESLRLIMESGIPYEFRTTWVPGFHTMPMLEEILRLIQGAEMYVIQNLSGFPTLDPELARIRPLSREEMKRLQAFATPSVRRCEIRNV